MTPSLVISPNNANATVALDGTLSSDPDGDSLTYLWLDRSAVVLGTKRCRCHIPAGRHQPHFAHR